MIYLYILLIIILGGLMLKFRAKTSFSKAIPAMLIISSLLIFVAWVDKNPKQLTNALDFFRQRDSSPIEDVVGYAENPYDDAVIKIKKSVLIDAPVINQFPELPRGCEVTSLAMMLQFAQVAVDKMQLAKEVKKDPTPKTISNGVIHFGNPADGFVGNMYTFNEPGLTVYHEPIKELAEAYLPGQIVDLTGGSFNELKVHLSDNRPVWVIINTEYRKLPSHYFQTWQTPTGKIQITYKVHSVLITGYDENNVYFNDPLTGEKNRSAPIKNFEEAWVQMGSQAITFLK